MRHDDDPSVDDLREVFRIVQRCLDLWHDPAAWRAEFAAAVRGIVNAGAPGGFGVLQLVGPATATSDRPTLIHIATTPWPSRDAEDLYRRSMDPDERVELPGFAAAAAPAMRGGTAAFSRPMIVDERSWRESRFYSEFVRAMGLGDFAASITASPSVPALTLVCGYRPDGAPPIPMRVVKCLGILAEEFVPYLGTRLALDDREHDRADAQAAADPRPAARRPEREADRPRASHQPGHRARLHGAAPSALRRVEPRRTAELLCAASAQARAEPMRPGAAHSAARTVLHGSARSAIVHARPAYRRLARLRLPGVESGAGRGLCGRARTSRARPADDPG